MRILSTLVMLMGLSTGGMYSVANTNPMPDKAAVERIQVRLDRLTNILSRLAPVRAAPPSLLGTAPNFVGVNYCWRFENGGPDLYSRVAQVINDFHGTMRWSFNSQFNQKGACIAAVASSSEFYTPVLDSKSLSAQAENDIAGGQRSFVDEIDKLCSFMESELGVAGQERKLPSKEASILDDQYEFGIYEVMLVRDVKRFHWPTPTSDVDKGLDFGLTYDEWYALFFQVLGKSEGQTEVHPVDFQGKVDGYPILSRLNDIHDDAAVEESEVAELESECLRLEVISRDNVAAQKCLRKLLLICRWAKNLKTGIYFSGE
jgi:hypothetical protein